MPTPLFSSPHHLSWKGEESDSLPEVLVPPPLELGQETPDSGLQETLSQVLSPPKPLLVSWVPPR